MSHFNQAPPEAKASLVRLLGLSATPQSLDVVRKSLKDPEPVVRKAAVRTLCSWPDPSPAEDLLGLAGSLENRAEKALALRGYVRMAGLSNDPSALYLRAMEVAATNDDRKLVLAGLGTADSAQALGLAQRYLKDAELQVEAGLAVVQIAGRLRRQDETRAKTALRDVIAAVSDQTVREQAQKVLNELEQYEGYLLAWEVAGPFKLKGKESRVVFDTPFPPEPPSTNQVKWQALKRGVGAWEVNLEAALESADHCAGYVRTRVWSPTKQPAKLELGSDDAIKAWLNGDLVHENYTHRGYQPRQDAVVVDLREGWNDLILKVVDHQGGWGFCARLRHLDGSALEGLRTSP
jgi:hypothetical protein